MAEVERKAKKLKVSHYSSEETKSDSPPSENTLKNEEKKSETKDEENKNVDTSEDISSILVAHYSSLKDSYPGKRNDSRIVYLRNFNNWIKSILIRDSVWQFPEEVKRNFKVLDMCCGKGGDLFKWSSLNIKYMICTDIVESNIEQYKARYREHINHCRRNRRSDPLECEFITADCTRVRLRGKYYDPSIRFDIVSCQFSFHYCFESLPQAECMLKNATECLKPGGLFIGTLPNANEIVKRLKEANSKIFKNDIFKVEMCSSEPYPLFGAKYYFYLEEVVNCPEFLVHFGTFERLAEKYGLKLIQKETFVDLFERKKKSRDGDLLLQKIRALETYPPEKDRKIGSVQDYAHAKNYCEMNNVKQVGTLSKSEWEVISLYLVFAFKKVENE